MSAERFGAAGVFAGGRAAVIGGVSRDSPALDSAEVFDVKNGRWSTLRLRRRRDAPCAVALDDRRVLVIGGGDGVYASPESEIIDLGAATEGARVSENAALGASPDTLAVQNRNEGWTVPDPLPSPRWSAATAMRGTSMKPTSRWPAMSFASKGPARPHDYAVIVGVGRYERLPPADFAEDDARDATAMMTALGVPEENIVTLSGPRASMTEVVKYVEEWLPAHVDPDSRVYFYYSGHGAPNILDGVPYLMPWDADAEFVKSTGLPLERVYAALGKLPAKEVIAMIDACFSGAGGRSVLAPGTRPLVTVRAPTRVPANISILTASGSNEIAGSEPRYGHGLFSYYVMRGLSGDADAAGTGQVTLRQLHAYVRKHVIIEAREENREQTPTLSTPDPGLRLY
jgi:hypothetical protein